MTEKSEETNAETANAGTNAGEAGNTAADFETQSDTASNTENRTAVNRNYKDTVFRMLFNDGKNSLSLYNALSGRKYTDVSLLEIVTLENAIYMSMKNDVAYIIDSKFHLVEHQSTKNPNMPFRFLQYVSAEYGKITVREDVYGSKAVKLPTPHFTVQCTQESSRCASVALCA